jgi:hypothetical protein
MRVIYEAENLLDGHLVKGLLEQRGIQAFVSGQYLTGALGELPVAGIVTVYVADDDEAAANDVIAELEADRRAFEAAQAAEEPEAEPGFFDELLAR